LAELEWNVPPMSAGAMLAAKPKKEEPQGHLN
jgi:hypothetical protein